MNYDDVMLMQHETATMVQLHVTHVNNSALGHVAEVSDVSYLTQMHKYDSVNNVGLPVKAKEKDYK